MGLAEFREDLAKAMRAMRDRPGGFPHLGTWHFASRPHVHLLTRGDDPERIQAELLAALRRVRKVYRADRVHAAAIRDLGNTVADLAEITPAKVPGMPPEGFTGRLTLASKGFYPKGIRELERAAARAASKKRLAAYRERRAIDREARKRVRQTYRALKEDSDDPEGGISPETADLDDPEALREARCQARRDALEAKREEARQAELANPRWGRGLTTGEIDEVYRLILFYRDCMGKKPRTGDAAVDAWLSRERRHRDYVRQGVRQRDKAALTRRIPLVVFRPAEFAALLADRDRRNRPPPAPVPPPWSLAPPLPWWQQPITDPAILSELDDDVPPAPPPPSLPPNWVPGWRRMGFERCRAEAYEALVAIQQEEYSLLRNSG
jgi:hypothetical protein